MDELKEASKERKEHLSPISPKQLASIKLNAALKNIVRLKYHWMKERTNERECVLNEMAQGTERGQKELLSPIHPKQVAAVKLNKFPATFENAVSPNE